MSIKRRGKKFSKDSSAGKPGSKFSYMLAAPLTKPAVPVLLLQHDFILQLG